MAERRPCITVLAGVNGAGKSSLAGAALRARGADYFNPDEAARLIRTRHAGMTMAEANSAAWGEGKRLLGHAIAERLDYVFESTLGGRTMAGLLAQAADAGFDVRMWYVGLTNPELHLARVRARVRRGGHDIPEHDIRRRYDASRANLVDLLPTLREVRVYDNSTDADPHTGVPPAPQLILHVVAGRIVAPRDLSKTPTWARPIVAAAMQLATRRP